uniref:Uncharacterized protein n=1 Tax=Glossina pallidipes TaxID=7398 RepID=A0A1B0ABS6_GLOPL
MQPLSNDEQRRYFPMNAKHHFTRNKFYFLRDLTFNHHLPVYEYGFGNPKFARTDIEHQSSIHILLEEYFESGNWENDSPNSKEEEEDNLNASGKRKRVRLLTNSDDSNDGNYGKENIEAAADGTVGRKIETGSPHGILTLRTIFEGVSRSAGHSKRNIIKRERSCSDLAK